MRDYAVRAPQYSLTDLAELDDRVEAHLDGLRIAGDAGWEKCKEGLGYEEAGEIFAAAILAFGSEDAVHIETVLEVGSALPELSRGLVSALSWLSYPQAQISIRQLLNTASPDLRRVGIAACAMHRQDPGYVLTAVLSDDELLLKAQALRAIGELGRIDLLPVLQSQLTVGDDLCQYSAAWSAALLGDLAAIPTLQDIARSDLPYREEAVNIALRRMEMAAARDWRQTLAQEQETMRLAVIGAGVIGDPASISWLIDHMAVPELARVAGEAFTMITGVDIADEALEGEWPESFETGPIEDPEDENVDMDPDEDLPWPDPELLSKWWYNHHSEFQPGTRYLIGKPMSFEWLHNVLRNGYQRQCAAAALELAMRQPGQPLFEVRAPGFRQQQLLRIHR